MENQIIKKVRGRPPTYLTKEEKKQAKARNTAKYRAKKRDEKQNVNKNRPSKYSTEEERKDTIKNSKTKYMLNKEWYCDICNTGLNYTLAGKHCHLKTKKHMFNKIENNIMEKLRHNT